MGSEEYKFELTGDYKAKLAAMSNGKNVIELNPLTASKAEFACYLMYAMMENSKQISAMTTTVGMLSASNEKLKGKVSDLETAATARDVEVRELKDELRNANLIIADQGRDIEVLKKRADQCDADTLDLERHSRSSNLRLGNCEETADENCKQIVSTVFEELGFTGVDIENCHRVGEKKAGKTRQIIVRFVRRTQLREVYSKRKEFFDKDYPLYEDIPYKDLVIKKKYKAEINQHYRNKDKCYFSRGAWYVNKVKKYW